MAQSTSKPKVAKLAPHTPSFPCSKMGGMSGELKKAENAWKPSFEEREDLDAGEQLNRKVRSILNKLTPQNCATLVNQFQELAIDTEAKLYSCVDLVFKQVLVNDKLAFSVAYAQMCKLVQMKKVSLDGQADQFVNFRKLLISRCQKEFEKDYMADLDQDHYIKDMNEAKTEDDKKRVEEKIELSKRHVKRGALRIISFIAELYKLKMLTARIMHECVKKLLKEADDDSLEHLCQLFITVGKELDQETRNRLQTSTPKQNVDLNDLGKYFKVMEVAMKDKKTSARVRFMIQDVLELSQNNWKKRRNNFGPSLDFGVSMVFNSLGIQAPEFVGGPTLSFVTPPTQGIHNFIANINYHGAPTDPYHDPQNQTFDTIGKDKWADNEKVVKLSQAISKKAKLEFLKRKEQLQHFENKKHSLEEQLYNTKIRITSTTLKTDEITTQQSKDMASLLTMLKNLEIKKLDADKELSRIDEQKIKVKETIEQLTKQIDAVKFRKSKLQFDQDEELKTLNEQTNGDKLIMDSLQLELEKLEGALDEIINGDTPEMSSKMAKPKEVATYTAEHIAELEHKIRMECLIKQIEDIEKLLECPLCFETAEAPIFECQEGHLVCSKCKPKITKCPECQIVYRGPDKRNRYAERDAEKLQALIQEVWQKNCDDASASNA